MSERFVLLRHECPGGVPKPSHWDLMLESGGVLLTWELHELPDFWRAALGCDTVRSPLGRVVGVPAIRLADHRLDYLDYEGAVSNNRGTVRQIDRGELVWVEQAPTRFVARLHVGRLAGSISLTEHSESYLLEVLR